MLGSVAAVAAAGVVVTSTPTLQLGTCSAFAFGMVGASRGVRYKAAAITLLLPGAASAADTGPALAKVVSSIPASSSSSDLGRDREPGCSGNTSCDAGFEGNSTFLDGDAWDLWGLVYAQVKTLAPPPPLVKCLGATLAGSLFALVGMLVEGLRDRERKAKPTKNGSSASPATAPRSTSAGASKEKCDSPPPATASGSTATPESNGPISAKSRRTQSSPIGGSTASRSPSTSTSTAEGTPSPLGSGSSGNAHISSPSPASGKGNIAGTASRLSNSAFAAEPIEAKHARSSSTSKFSSLLGSHKEKGEWSPASATATPVSSNGPGSQASTKQRRPSSSPEGGSPSPSPATPVAGGASVTARPSLRTSSFGAELTEVEKSERQVKSILNKLTREKFDRLYTQLLECLANQQEDSRPKVVDVVAREVFAKATMEHSFVEMYADVCSKLSEDLGQQYGVQVNFRTALLDQCQRSFNLHLEAPRIDGDLDYEERYEELVKYKTRMLGNVRLIGQLLKRRMLSAKIVFHCTDELLSIGSPEALETLCAFLQTVGPTFDTPKWQGHSRLEGVFLRTELFAQDSRQCPRIRCLLKDLLDKRKNQWREPSPKATAVNGPGSLAHEGRTSSNQGKDAGSWRNADWRDAVKASTVK